MQGRVSRRLLLLWCGSSVLGLGGCSDIFENEQPQAEADDGEPDDGSETETTDDDGSTDEATEEGEEDSEQYSVSFDTEQVLLSQDDVPDGYSLYTDDLQRYTDSEDSDSPEDGVLIRHERSYLGEDNGLIDPRAIVFHTEEQAQGELEQKVSSVDQSGGEVVSRDKTYPIETVVVEDESESGERVRYYFGRDKNLLVELLILGDVEVGVMDRLYREMVSI